MKDDGKPRVPTQLVPKPFPNAYRLGDIFDLQDDESFAIKSNPSFSPSGVPYLTRPGVGLFVGPSYEDSGVEEFLESFNRPDEKMFDSYDYTERFLQSGQNGELGSGDAATMVAGQLCYMAFDSHRSVPYKFWTPDDTHNDDPLKDNREAGDYFHNLKAQRHGSVFRHAQYGFVLWGIDRSLTHELVRHVHANPSQVSQRYVTAKTLRFVERPEYQGDDTLHAAFEAHIESVVAEHQDLIGVLTRRQEAGWPSLQADSATDRRKKVMQAARSILPNDTEAPMVFSAGLEEWREIIERRASSFAEMQIRQLSVMIYSILVRMEPQTFSDYELVPSSDGIPTLSTMTDRV